MWLHPQVNLQRGRSQHQVYYTLLSFPMSYRLRCLSFLWYCSTILYPLLLIPKAQICSERVEDFSESLVMEFRKHCYKMFLYYSQQVDLSVLKWFLDNFILHYWMSVSVYFTLFMISETGSVMFEVKEITL